MSLHVDEIRIATETKADIVEALTAVVNAAAQITREHVKAEVGSVRTDLAAIKKQVAQLQAQRKRRSA